MSATPEFSRVVHLRHVDARPHRLEANEAERAALAKRFGLVSIGRLEAEVELARNGEAVDADGTLAADIVQSCAVSGEDLPVAIREPLAFRFVPDEPAATNEEEIELESSELDEIPYSGGAFDLGEAVAQSLALAIDPYAIGPNAEAARKEAGLLDENDAGPFAALKGLRDGRE
jgi:uncharacterized metal-binding protein YceD (DUF177 family)